jgi:hypothetical protein
MYNNIRRTLRAPAVKGVHVYCMILEVEITIHIILGPLVLVSET